MPADKHATPPELSHSANRTTSTSQAVEVALQENRGGHRIHFFFSFVAAHVALDQHAVGLRRGKPLIPQFDGHAYEAFERFHEFLDFLGGGAVAAVHIPGHPDEDQLHLFYINQFVKARQESREWRRGNKLKRLGNHLQLVADGDADPLASVVNGEDAHVVSPLSSPFRPLQSNYLVVMRAVVGPASVMVKALSQAAPAHRTSPDHPAPRSPPGRPAAACA